MDRVRFYFDPRCPWCYQTSRWARRLEELGEVDLDWGVFSLEVVNLEEGKDPLELEATGSPALRTCVAIAGRRAGVLVTRGCRSSNPQYIRTLRKLFVINSLKHRRYGE